MSDINLSNPFSSEFSPQLLAHLAGQVDFQRLHWPAIEHKQLNVFLRRDDQLSQYCPGNKFYKLFYNLQAMVDEGLNALVSFGGAYSNHIHALAAAGHQYGFATVGIIRGHSPKKLSPTLQDAQDWGMQLLFLDKESYRNHDLSCVDEQLRDTYGDYYLLPEGGENALAVKGCMAIGHAIAKRFVDNYTVCSALGSGTTFAGITAASPSTAQCLGISVLKGYNTLTDSVAQWLQSLQYPHPNWRVVDGFHHGGYAKLTSALLDFMLRLESDNALQLEPVYSAKMLWGIEQLALQDFWPPGSTIVAVHGGGLQGRRGFAQLSGLA